MRSRYSTSKIAFASTCAGPSWTSRYRRSRSASRLSRTRGATSGLGSPPCGSGAMPEPTTCAARLRFGGALIRARELVDQLARASDVLAEPVDDRVELRL